MIKCKSKNMHLKNMCLLNIGVYPQNMLTIVSSIINMIWGVGGRLYDHMMNMRIFTLIMKKIPK